MANSKRKDFIRDIISYSYTLVNGEGEGCLFGKYIMCDTETAKRIQEEYNNIIDKE